MKKFSDKVVYQIYPKSFLDTTGNGIGDINGIISKLDYISNLGVDYIWLSPVCLSPQKDNGYDIANYYQIDPLFGTNEDYCKFIELAKSNGMKVMMDLVLNHVSSEHEWFKKACNNDPEYIDYFIWRDEPNDIFNFFGPTSWTYVESVGKYYLHFFDVSQPDLNWENPKVREEIYNMVNYWIDKGVEGFRLDVIDIIGKEPDKMIMAKGPKFYEYLKELNNNTFGENILTVGECWNATIEEANLMCNKDGLSQIFHFQHLTIDHQEDKWLKADLDYNKVINIIEKWQNNYEGTTTQVLNNHDTPRLISNWFNDNEHRYESATLAGALFHLLSGTSYIYQGEEIGMTNAYMDNICNYNDVECINRYNKFVDEGHSEEYIIDLIKYRSRDNARTPMQWDESINAGFSNGAPWLNVNKNYQDINVSKDLNAKKSVYKFYQSLISFKKTNIDLINTPIIDITFEDGIIKYIKKNLIFIGNTTDEIKAIDIDVYDSNALSNYDEVDKLQPYQCIVYKI